ncbi:MAG: hypothetical protein HY609_04830, partial [Deltaproteobacteria bacterium]|nr:hypothetical protein [Deltaproteobacteria bacterium]
MKWIPVLLILSLTAAVQAEPVEEYYQEVAKTVSLPYELEGLGPILDPSGREHYRFSRDERGQVLRVTHYNEKGEITDNAEGWADFHAFYDANGVVLSVGYYDTSGR